MLTMPEPHTALYVAPLGLENTFSLGFTRACVLQSFRFNIILCPTLRYNKTYHLRKWFWTDSYVIPKELGDSSGSRLYDWSEKLGNLLAEHKTLFLIDNTIADEMLDKRRQPLLGLSISGRHRGHSLWLLTQSYTGVLGDNQKCFMLGTRKSEETGM